MLQVLIRNRIFFIMCLALIWMLIFLMPSIGNYVKTKRMQFEHEKKLSQRKPVHQLMKEELSINHLHAGMFYQGADKTCLDSLGKKEGDKPGLWKCHGEGRHQFWFIMKDTNALRNKELCLEGPIDLGKPGEVTLEKCSTDRENQAWIYEDEFLKLSGGELCLESELKSKKVSVTICNSEKTSQKWKLETPEGY